MIPGVSSLRFGFKILWQKQQLHHLQIVPIAMASRVDLWPNGSNPLELSDCINEIMQNPNNKSLKQEPCSTAFLFCMKDVAYSFAPILVQKPSYRLSIIKIYPADT